MSRHVSKWGTSKNPHGMCISSWKSMNLRANFWEIYIVSNASRAILVTQKKKWQRCAGTYTKNIFFGSNFVQKKQKLPTKDKVQKILQAAERAFFNIHKSISCNQGRQDWRSSMRSSNLGGFNAGFFFVDLFWSRIFFLKAIFFWDTKKNVMKKKIDASVMDFWSL